MKTLQLKTVTALCLLVLFTGTIVKAQDRKPSKEETIEFINKFLKSQNNNDLKCRIYIKEWDEYETSNISNLKGSISVLESTVNLFVSYTKEVEFVQPKKTQKIFIDSDLDQTEEIQIVAKGTTPVDGSSKCYVWGLYFKEKGEEDFNSTLEYLPLWKGAPGDDYKKYKETQIYKAFEHLRKMAGGPEPLKF